MKDKILNITKKFDIDDEFISYETLKSGHINDTYKVNFKDSSYILQRINTYVFKNPIQTMENIYGVSSHIKNELTKLNKDFYRHVLEYKTINNIPYFIDNDDFYRCYKYVDNSITFDYTDNLSLIEETGKAFGNFHNNLANYDISSLNIVIPHFHNTINRYELFKESVDKDTLSRANDIKDVIDSYMSLKDLATTMYKMQREGKLPLRVTHNDTKCNNVLFDKDTLNHLAVIDLDTVMPGLIGFDFGDAIRFIANSSKEDETDTSKIYIDLNKFEAFTKGFVGFAGSSLTENEKNTLSLGAITMTIECGLRFLTDYLDGDNYFKTSYPEHNLDRARCQLALANNMILKSL